MVFCIKCGFDMTVESAKFCPKCGILQEKQHSESFCTKCGTKVYENNPCTNCNQQSNKSIQDKITTSTATSGIPERILEFFPVIFGIFGGILAWFSLRNRNPKKARYLLKVGIVYMLVLMGTFIAIMIINQIFLH